MNCKRCLHPQWTHLPKCESVIGYTNVKHSEKEVNGHKIYTWTGESLGDCDCEQFIAKGIRKHPKQETLF